MCGFFDKKQTVNNSIILKNRKKIDFVQNLREFILFFLRLLEYFGELIILAANIIDSHKSYLDVAQW